MSLSPPDPVAFSAQAIPFWELLETGKVSDEDLRTESVAQQFVERLGHDVLSLPSQLVSIPQLSTILEQIDTSQKIFFLKRLQAPSPSSLKEFAPLYYEVMAAFHPLLFAGPFSQDMVNRHREDGSWRRPMERGSMRTKGNRQCATIPREQRTTEEKCRDK